MTDGQSEGVATVGGPLQMTMGGDVVPVRPLTLREGDEWTALLSAAMLPPEVDASTDNTAIVQALFRASSDAALSLLVAYDHDGALGGAENIRDHMTKRELKAALDLMVTVEVPFGEGGDRLVVEAFGLPARLIAVGMAVASEAVTEPMLRLVRSQSSPSLTGDSTTPGTSIPSGPASSSSSRGRTRSTGSSRTSKRAAS